MKISYFQDIEEEGTEKAQLSTISNDTIGFIIGMLSNMYSDKVGSIVREIASNCIDSHVEAGVVAPIHIGIVENSGETLICFEDFGVGMSDERIAKFIDYGQSTKRDSQDLLGGFGIGGKSPFSYTDHYYIRTRYNGKETEYVYFKSNVTVPKLLIVYTKEIEDPDITNGTAIKIPIDPNDTSKFIHALKYQLTYFDNVYYSVGDYVLDANDSPIIETDLFKYNPVIGTVDSKTKILLGNVVYPIDWSVITAFKDFCVPVGLKFEIGELEVTPSRENIKYTESAIQLIEHRLRALHKDLQKRALRNIKNYANLTEYMKRRSEHRQEDIVIYDNHKLSLDYRVFSKLPEPRIEAFKDFDRYDFNIPADIFFNYRMYGKIKKGTLFTKVNKYSVQRLWKDKSSYKLLYLDKEPEKIKNKYIDYAYLVKRYALGNGTVHSEMNYFKNYLDFKEVNENNTNANDFTKELTSMRKSVKYMPVMNFLYLYKEYRRQAEEALLSVFSLYSSIKIPEGFNIRNNIDYADSREIRKINGKLLLTMYSDGYGDFKARDEYKISDVLLCKGVFIVGTIKEKRRLELIAPYITGMANNRKIKNTPFNTYNVLYTSTENLQYFSKRSNCCHIDYFMTNNKIFIKLATALLVKDNKAYNYLKDKHESFSGINANIAAIGKLLVDYVKQFPNHTDSVAQIAIKEAAKEGNLYDPYIISLLNKIDKYFRGVEIIYNLNNYVADEVVVDFLVRNHKFVNYQWYESKPELKNYLGYDKEEKDILERLADNEENYIGEIKKLTTIKKYEQEKSYIETYGAADYPNFG